MLCPGYTWRIGIWVSGRRAPPTSRPLLKYKTRTAGCSRIRHCTPTTMHVPARTHTQPCWLCLLPSLTCGHQGYTRSHRGLPAISVPCRLCSTPSLFHAVSVLCAVSLVPLYARSPRARLWQDRAPAVSLAHSRRRSAVSRPAAPSPRAPPPRCLAPRLAVSPSRASRRLRTRLSRCIPRTLACLL